MSQLCINNYELFYNLSQGWNCKIELANAPVAHIDRKKKTTNLNSKGPTLKVSPLSNLRVTTKKEKKKV
jgi:hypothetical protein